MSEENIIEYVMTPEIIGKFLTRAKDQSGLSTKIIGQRMNITYPMIYSWQKAQKRISAEYLFQFIEITQSQKLFIEFFIEKYAIDISYQDQGKSGKKLYEQFSSKLISIERRLLEGEAERKKLKEFIRKLTSLNDEI